MLTFRRVEQTLFKPEPGDEHTAGNCFAACVASILDLSLEVVPNFCALGKGEWYDAFAGWLIDRGYAPIFVEINPERPFMGAHGSESAPTYIIVSGKSPRGEWDHSTVWRSTGKVIEPWHDPHPSGEFLDGDPKDYICITPVWRGE